MNEEEEEEEEEGAYLIYNIYIVLRVSLAYYTIMAPEDMIEISSSIYICDRMM